MAEFTHLHLHTQYSFLNGAIHMGDLCPRIADLGMDACAVTETGNMFSAIDFYRRAKDHDLKPILGTEVEVTSDVEGDKPQHLVLLAKNHEGYSNLAYVVSKSWREGFVDGKPVVSREVLQGRTGGLFGLSACADGTISQSILEGNSDRAREQANYFKQIFAPEHYFLELQARGTSTYELINNTLKQLAADTGIPLVASNDCHYKMRDDAVAHDVLNAIRQGKARHDPTRSRMESDALYIRSSEEMCTLFRDCPEAIANTQRIVEAVDLELVLGKPQLPTFLPEDGSDLESHLRDRALQGLRERFREVPYKVDQDEYLARLEEELGIIIGMNFPGYFLIVADFILWAKENDIPVGPGRGSGAGSLVAYALRITDLDPLPYNLLFERFLNPERVSMPDFDVDFCQARRGEVIDYVTQKYGPTKVGQIATFAQMKAKSVIKDVARCLELPFQEVNDLTKLLPNVYKDEKGSVKPITIQKALELEPRLGALQNESDTYREVIEIAQKLEGLYRQAGMHAAGIVIGDEDLWELVPVFRGNDNELVTQFSMTDVELAGLVKFDFLGLKTLDVVHGAEGHVNERIVEEFAAGDWAALVKHRHLQVAHKKPEALKACVEEKKLKAEDLFLDCARLPLDDSKVYQLISRGETLGVFQLESTGFQELLKRLKPDCFEDVVAAVALYRPGPLQTGMVDDFVDCKRGRKQVTYPHPLLEGVLQPTYGGFVYQEQVMQAAQVMAGYSLGGADLLRRAMGKKKVEVMAKERVKFVAGCKEKGITDEESASVFDLMEKFAGYGFNKSHSAAYALITYHTGYLKTFYPVEFMAALLSTEANNTDNIVKYIGEAKRMKVAVLGPSVNESDRSFTVPRGQIRFGLGAIKGLGGAALDVLLSARDEAGAFSSLYDFCERVPLKQLNKKTLEALVKSGAFDDFGRPRAQLLDALGGAMEAAKSVQKSQAAGQESLFGSPELRSAVKPREVYDESIPEWPELERLQYEKKATGFFLSGHPLDRYREELKRIAPTSLAELERITEPRELTLGCIVTALRERPLRNGTGRMAFVTLEDGTALVEMLVSARVYENSQEVFGSGVPILVKCQVSTMTNDDGTTRVRMRVNGASKISDARLQNTKRVTVKLPEDRVDEDRLRALQGVFHEHQGNCPVRLLVEVPGTAEVEFKLPDQTKVCPVDGLIDGVEALFGCGSVQCQ